MGSPSPRLLLDAERLLEQYRTSKAEAQEMVDTAPSMVDKLQAMGRFEAFEALVFGLEAYIARSRGRVALS